MLHTHYQTAKPHNLFGITHTHAPNEQFIHKLKQAGDVTQLECSTDIEQTLRDTLTTDGPCPAIVVGDGSHFRTVLINAKTKSISLIDPFREGFSTDLKTSIISLYSKDTSGH